MAKVLFLLSVLPLGLIAQAHDSVRRSDFGRMADGIYKIQTAPLRWKGHDWIKFGGVFLVTAAMTQADQPIRNFAQAGRCDFMEGVNNVGYHYGKAYSAVALTGGFYLTGLAFKNEWARETGVALGTGLASASILSMGLKPLIGRARPSRNMGNQEIRYFSNDPDFHSFPSGHTTVAFTASFILAKRVKSVPLKIGFYSLAATTAACRLYSDAHWISDIAFGGAIAWFCSEAAIRSLEGNKYRIKKPRKVDWNVSPYYTGLSFRGTF